MLLTTATLSLGGLSGAVANASAQETDPLQGEDVSVSLGDVTASFGRATLAFEDSTMQFRGDGWTIEGPESTLTGDALQVTIDDVSAETYATVRAGMIDTVEHNSPVSVIATLATADVNPDASVRVSASPIEQDGQVVADQMTATGRFEQVAPEGVRELGADDTTLQGGAALGPSKWDQLTIQRGDSELVIDDVVITVHPADITESVRDIQFDLMFGTVTRDGKTLVSNFETSGTLAELLQVLSARNSEDDADGSGRLPNEVIVSSPGTDERLTYTFEVTGDLEKLEPNEDSAGAIDEVSNRGDRVRVEGAVSTGDDRFAFSGELIEVDIPPEVSLEITER